MEKRKGGKDGAKRKKKTSISVVERKQRGTGTGRHEVGKRGADGKPGRGKKRERGMQPTEKDKNNIDKKP